MYYFVRLLFANSVLTEEQIRELLDEIDPNDSDLEGEDEDDDVDDMGINISNNVNSDSVLPAAVDDDYSESENELETTGTTSVEQRRHYGRWRHKDE